MTASPIVEDYSPSRTVPEAVLASASYCVIEAKDGVEALSRIRAEHPDLAIADILKNEEPKAQSVNSIARPILVVEDNPMDFDLMLQAFEESRITNPIRVCRDGEEALQFIETHITPDDPNLPLLVLFDLRLPKVDGVEVLRQARKHPVWRQIPFIVVTTSHENADISLAYEHGANSYIVKPVDFNSFVDVVKNIKVYWLMTNEPPFTDNARRPS